MPAAPFRAVEITAAASRCALQARPAKPRQAPGRRAAVAVLSRRVLTRLPRPRLQLSGRPYRDSQPWPRCRAPQCGTEPHKAAAASHSPGRAGSGLPAVQSRTAAVRPGGKAFEAVEAVKAPTAVARPGKLTCFTCTNGTDNDQCNKYAVDRPCEPGLTLCRTDHVIERFPVPVGAAGAGAGAPPRPRSVRITKSCVAASECSRASVGCRGVAGDSTYLRVCTSCCDWSYCNELAPADTITAVLALSRNGAGPSVLQPLPFLCAATVLLAVMSAVF